MSLNHSLMLALNPRHNISLRPSLDLRLNLSLNFNF